MKFANMYYSVHIHVFLSDLLICLHYTAHLHGTFNYIIKSEFTAHSPYPQSSGRPHAGLKLPDLTARNFPSLHIAGAAKSPGADTN